MIIDDNWTSGWKPTQQERVHRELTRAAVKRLKEIQKNKDIETGHQEADDVLRDLLFDLGYGAVVREYRKIKKWFA